LRQCSDSRITLIFGPIKFVDGVYVNVGCVQGGLENEVTVFDCPHLQNP